MGVRVAVRQAIIRIAVYSYVHKFGELIAGLLLIERQLVTLAHGST